MAYGPGGEILDRKISSCHIPDLAEAFAPSARRHIVGMRTGEKSDDEIVASSDSKLTGNLGPRNAIRPSGSASMHACYIKATRRPPPGTDSPLALISTE